MYIQAAYVAEGPLSIQLISCCLVYNVIKAHLRLSGIYLKEGSIEKPNIFLQEVTATVIEL